MFPLWTLVITLDPISFQRIQNNHLFSRSLTYSYLHRPFCEVQKHTYRFQGLDVEIFGGSITRPTTAVMFTVKPPNNFGSLSRDTSFPQCFHWFVPGFISTTLGTCRMKAACLMYYWFSQWRRMRLEGSCYSPREGASVRAIVHGRGPGHPESPPRPLCFPSRREEFLGNLSLAAAI